MFVAFDLLCVFCIVLGLLPDCMVFIYLPDDKPSSAKKSSNPESSSVNPQAGNRGPSSQPGAPFANPFDFSALSGLLDVLYILWKLFLF